MFATCPPEQGRRCFDQLPATIERLLLGATSGPALDEPLLRGRFDRVALVYLDAFGWHFSSGSTTIRFFAVSAPMGSSRS